MNLLGRLLIVLIFVGSIMLMSFSVVLYATHTNWRERSQNLTQQLGQKEQELTTLRAQKAAMEAALNLEINRQRARTIDLADRVRLLTQDNDEKQGQLAELNATRAQEVATVEAALEETERLRVRLDGASRALHDAQNDWVDMSSQLVRKIDEAHSLSLQLVTFQSVTAQLANDYADAVEVLRKHGLSADPALYTQVPPSGIHGTVTEIRPRGFIEISIGSDSGLVRGHQLDIVRNRDGRSSYVGKVEIAETAPDRAVARVMPEFRRGVVQRGDEVTYIELNELVAH